MSEQMLKRWNKAHDLFLKGEIENALNLFQLIELSSPDKTLVPIEISFNKLLAIVALEDHDHTVEVGSRLLKSSLGPFFLYALGLLLVNVCSEDALLYFRKSLMSLGDSLELKLPGADWKLTKYKIYINLAILSRRENNLALANIYLVKAEDVAQEPELKNIAQSYRTKGLFEVSFFKFPKYVCIPPPGKASGTREQAGISKPQDTQVNSLTEPVSPYITELTLEKNDSNPAGKESQMGDLVLDSQKLNLKNQDSGVYLYNRNNSLVQDTQVAKDSNRGLETKESNKEEKDSLVTPLKVLETQSLDQEILKDSTSEGSNQLPTPVENKKENNFQGNNIFTDLANVEKHSLATPRQSPDPQFYSYLQKLGKYSNSTHLPNIQTQICKDSEDIKSPPLRKASKLYTTTPTFESVIQSRKESGDLKYSFENTVHVQIFGIWKVFAVQIDGKIMKLFEKTMETVQMEISLEKTCTIEPVTDISYRKLHLFKLLVDGDELIFGLPNLSTSLEWISVIMKTALDLPYGPKEVILLQTGLGKEPFDPSDDDSDS